MSNINHGKTGEHWRAHKTYDTSIKTSQSCGLNPRQIGFLLCVISTVFMVTLIVGVAGAVMS